MTTASRQHHVSDGICRSERRSLSVCSSSSSTHSTWARVRPVLGCLDKLLKTYWIVHGSLARAGKVKSQTPKVEKQEKKKTPKGRAKKRIIYNRRCVTTSSRWNIVSDICNSFVNVTTLPGGKRRM